MMRQWEPTTRGKHHLKDVYRDPTANGRFVFFGKVCLNGDGKTPPSEDPRDWQGECWDEHGMYYYEHESDLDLMEVQDGTDN
jgi:hypothetical protein